MKENTHGHDNFPVGSIGWHFHYIDHDELVHCEGGEKNPYRIKHITIDDKLKHGINKEYARGHGINTEPQWFQFVKKLNDSKYDLLSGKKIDVDNVPNEFKNKECNMPEIDLITQRMKLKDIVPALLSKEWVGITGQSDFMNIKSKYGIDPNDAEYIRKGLTASDLRFEPGERAVISHITTGAKDRDNEIVDPKGAILEDYENNRVVLFGHDHSKLPIGKNEWIKTDKKGLVAKTVYAGHEEADKVYNYRKNGFPLAQSIGFIPVEWTDFSEGDKTPEAKQGVRRRYDKWILLEYSDVPVPSNPEAVAMAVSKSLITLADVIDSHVKEDDIILLLDEEEKTLDDAVDEIISDSNIPKSNEDNNTMTLTQEEHEACKQWKEEKEITKPEWDETETSFRYRVRDPKLFQEDSMRTVPIKRDKPRVQAVMGRLKDEDTMTIQSLIFPKDDDWTLADAKKWLKKHDELLKFMDYYVNAVFKDYIIGIPETIDDETEKAGRTLSAKTRKIMSTAVNAMSAATTALNTLMESSDNKPDEEEDSKSTQPIEKEEVEIILENEDGNGKKDALEIDVNDIEALLKKKLGRVMSGLIKDEAEVVVKKMLGKV